MFYNYFKKHVTCNCMEKDLGDYRKSYEKGELLLNEVPEDPMELFQKWFHEVDSFFPEDETNTMTISTMGLDGFPKNRVVLLKKYTYEGFIFYTNYASEKGKAILVLSFSMLVLL